MANKTEARRAVSYLRLTWWRLKWWRPWYTVRFYGGPLDGVTRRQRRAGWVFLDERGEPVQTLDDCYWLLHEPEGERRVAYAWDTEDTEGDPCPCCGPLVLVESA